MRQRLTSFLFLLLALASASAQNSRYIAAVDEDVPAPGQFVNTMPEATANDTPETMAQKCTQQLADNAGELVTLGAYGGYITFHFDHPVVNVAGQMDFFIAGNANNGGSEAGIVMVSQDTNGNGLPDDAWYDLAGSADEDSIGKVTYGYSITYKKQGELQNVPWSDSLEGTGKVPRNGFHSQEYFPLWLGDELTFSGTLLPTNARNTSATAQNWLLSSLRYGYVDNVPNSDSVANSFNLDWAVMPVSREPVNLTHADFIRVYTALNQVCGWIGETSTEISGAEDLHLEASLAWADGISELDNSTISQFDKCFDLQGRQRSMFNVQRSTSPGLYIKNGKKFIY